MSIIKIDEKQTFMSCPVCGKEFTYPFSKAEMEDKMFGHFWRSLLERQECDECVAVSEAKQLEIDKKEAEEQHLMNLPSLYSEANLPPRLIFDKGDIPVRTVANWMWHRKDKNILLSGSTGVGKSTSAVSCLSRIIKYLHGRVYYTDFQSLLPKWRMAKMGDVKRNYDPVEAFKSIYSSYDVLCIDEICGKGRMSEAGEELLYSLLNGVSNGTFTAKLWLLGNMRGRTLNTMFNDYEAVKRRLAESFICGVITEDAVVQQIDVWSDF